LFINTCCCADLVNLKLKYSYELNVSEHHIVLYNIVLYNIVLYNIVLYNIVLYHIVLYHIVLYNIVLYNAAYNNQTKISYYNISNDANKYVNNVINKIVDEYVRCVSVAMLQLN